MPSSSMVEQQIDTHQPKPCSIGHPATTFDELLGVLPSSRKMEAREWWLLGLAVVVTLVLTCAIVALSFPQNDLLRATVYNFNLREWVRALAALVLLFDVYTIYQQVQLQRMRRQIAGRDRLFQLITDNAADMIALVGSEGQRIYNSPAYEKVLGYTIDELRTTSSLDQVHPEDLVRVRQAAENARAGHAGKMLEYRMRHKNGSWRVLESTSSVVRNADGEMGGLIIVNRDITERKRAEEALNHNAFYDSLTNLANRNLLLDRVGRALAIARRHPGFNFGILCIDIDGFKIVNDSLGHAAGDELLIQIGSRLVACLRASDMISRSPRKDCKDIDTGEMTLARPGGDEFVVVAEELRHPSDAIHIAERIHRVLGSPFDLNGHKIVVTGSIGIVLSANASAEAEGVLRDAEIAMYRAKNAGKARWDVFDKGMHTSALNRLQLETDMRQALGRGEFRVHYQPIVALEDERVIGFEALTRWQRPQGMVMPAEFIPLADETGLIVSINRELLAEACRQLLDWQRVFPAEKPLFISVNVTSREFGQPDLASEMRRIIDASAIDPRCIALEITETIAMADVQKSAAVLAQLKELGVAIDIDDFGTGYSSLSRLQSFRVDTLKIDRTFISHIDSDRETYEIVRIIVMLAHTLGLKVVAEGIENREQLDLLRALKCNFGQGYFFSKPADGPTIEAFLTAERARRISSYPETLASQSTQPCIPHAVRLS
jgi:PAS domain S-box-containing protein